MHMINGFPHTIPAPTERSHQSYMYMSRAIKKKEKFKKKNLISRKKNENKKSLLLNGRDEVHVHTYYILYARIRVQSSCTYSKELGACHQSR